MAPDKNNTTRTSASRTAPTDALNNRLFFRLMQSSNVYEREVQRQVNVSSVQGAVLGALSRELENGLSFSTLVTYLAVSRQNLDAVLKRLERLHYVKREESPEDRRVKIVRITPQGLAFWDKIYAQSFQLYRQATLGITSDEKKLLIELLSKIGKNLKSSLS